MLRLSLSFLLIVLTVGCSTISKRDRERALLHMQIGTGYLQQGQYPLAMSELQKAERLDPTNPLILNNLGLSYYVRGKTEVAEKKFREAIRLDTRYSDAKNNLARMMIETGQAKKALGILGEVEGDLTYQFPEKTLSNYGMAYFNLGQYKKAEEYLLRARQLRRENCVTANFYGRTLLAQKRMAESAEALDQAIEYCRDIHFEEPLYFSAMSYYSLGQREKSRARLEELLKDYPKSKYVAKAKGMLELLGE
ncbi:MAG: tetratricopeptide repeat protein [Bdellovibrionales bacterium]